MTVNKELCKQAAETLHQAFAWADTEEGHNYWSEVYVKLSNMAGVDPNRPLTVEIES
jgi:hypothetical protein